MRILLTATAAVLAAVALYLTFTLPPGAVHTAVFADEALASRTIPGAYHVHSNVSDGSSSRDDIAEAAAGAGLRFVIFTDHGDGMRVPEPPRYAHGVLCLDGVEISTNGGHYVALDMRPSPYPLGGEAAAVVEDVRRLGGFGIAAHPFSAKPELRWTDWSAPVDGLEWLNADSEWRDESTMRLLRLPFDYLLRPQSALASILDRPQRELAQFDRIVTQRPIVALAAHDAHGGPGSVEGSSAPIPRFPSYGASFRAFAIRAITETALTGSPADDGRLVLDAIRRGRVFTAIDGIAAPALLDFSAQSSATTAQMGDSFPFEAGVDLAVRAALPPGGALALICDGLEVAMSQTGELRQTPQAATACRPEVRAPQAAGPRQVPWIVGNPIHLISAVAEPVGSEPLYETSLVLDEVDWIVESDPASHAEISVEDGTMSLQFALKRGERTSQYAAAVVPLTPPLPPYDRIFFTADANAPMRVSIQLRFAQGERWFSSVYVEPDARRVILPVADLAHAGDRSAARPDFRQATSILFVVDLTNAVPGASGLVRIRDLALGAPVGR
jgi:hypothetical protein